LWGEDEAGPYQAIPQPGACWQPIGKPALRPHEYIRGGTAKMLTLFRPATGVVRAQPVEQATNAVLHPWLKRELEAVLAQETPVLDREGPGRQWSDWGWSEEEVARFDPRPPAERSPVRIVLVWDNLKGHKTASMVAWCIERGIVPLYTPLGGSWLNLTESVQRILVRRALAGQHPRGPQELMDWLAAAVRGWNQTPTPFQWGAKRAARRQRARERRHALAGSGGYTRRPVARQHRSATFQPSCNGYVRAN
jgi:transposase